MAVSPGGGDRSGAAGVVGAIPAFASCTLGRSPQGRCPWGAERSKADGGDRPSWVGKDDYPALSGAEGGEGGSIGGGADRASGGRCAPLLGLEPPGIHPGPLGVDCGRLKALGHRGRPGGSPRTAGASTMDPSPRQSGQGGFTLSRGRGRAFVEILG